MPLNPNLLDPRAAGAVSGPRPRQVQDAKNTQKAIDERASKRGLDPPPYEFLELIGKGSYGRVYKSRNRNTQQICAVKIIESDSQDYLGSQDYFNREDSIKDFLKETNMLQTLKDHRAQNVNVIHEAFSFDSQLWIVSDYCPGGSLSTLMKAVQSKQLPEKYIIPIAREVLVALKGIHGAKIIHRDVKCANILVTEDGRIQLCDFGISAMLENEVSKRSTIIGTPHWMPPELVEYLDSDAQFVRYGTEVDIWSFGCAVHEMATGLPPNSRVRVHELGPWLRRNEPGLTGGNWSDELRDFVSLCLRTDPVSRPSAADLLEHPYIANTSDLYPAFGISQLVEEYALWEQSGGQRTSLFNGLGAPAADSLSPENGLGEDWNFSTTAEFDKRMSVRLDPNFLANQPPMTSKNLHAFDKFVEEQRVERGGRQLNRIFDTNSGGYGKRISDLPLRNLADAPAADRTTLIDLDISIPGLDDTPSLSLDLASVPTIRAKRMTRAIEDNDDYEDTLHDSRNSTFNLSVDPPSHQDEMNLNRRTQDWKFPWAAAAEPPQNDANLGQGAFNTDRPNRKTQDWKFPTAEEFSRASSSFDESDDSPDYGGFAPSRPALRHAETMPTTMNRSDSPDRGSMIDLDMALNLDIPDTRPSTSGSMTGSSASELSANPFDLDDQFQMSELAQAQNRASFHMKSISEPTAGYRNGTAVSTPRDRDYGSEPESDVGGTIRAVKTAGRSRSQSQTSTSSSLAASSSTENIELPADFLPNWGLVNNPTANPDDLANELGRLLDYVNEQVGAIIKLTES